MEQTQETIKTQKILLIDDEPEIRRMVDGILRSDGFTRIFTAGNCTEALASLPQINPGLILLDVMLPDGDGFSLLSQIRKFSQVPALFLTALGEDDDRLLGLGLGADDYLVKPFLPRELTLRVNAILKRVYLPLVREEEKLPVFRLGGAVIDLKGACVKRDGNQTPLTAKEHALLRKLFENNGKVVTSDALCQAAWGDGFFGYENTLMVHIRRIREKIEENPSDPKHLLTVRGLGYKLTGGEPL